MYTGIDRRVFERIGETLNVRCMPEKELEEFYTNIINISGSGARIILLKKISPGTLLDMEVFRKDSAQGIKCRAKVVWVAPSQLGYFEAGIKFMNPDLMCIGRLISKLDNYIGTPSFN